MTWEEKAKEWFRPQRVQHRAQAIDLPHQSISHWWRRVALSVALVMAVALPLPYADTAQAFVGTSDYSRVFDKGSSFGEVADFVGDSTLLCASTLNREQYDYVPGTGWFSGGAFVTKKPISLLNSWEVKFTGDISPLQWRDDLGDISSSILLGFSESGALDDLNGYAWSWGENKTASVAGTQSILSIWNYTHSIASSLALGPVAAPNASRQSGTFSYNAQTGIATLSIGAHSISSTVSLRDIMGESAYFFVGGTIAWQSLDRSGTLCTPSDMQIKCTFDSISFPNLDAAFSNTLYRLNEETGQFDLPVTDIEELDPADIVQVRCSIANASPNASSAALDEQFSLHLKIACTEAYPTYGLVPFADSEHPVTIDNTPVDLAEDPHPLTGGTGVPIVLKGYNNPVNVIYYARVNELGDSTLKISHELTEDTFQVSQFHAIAFISLKEPSNDPTLAPGYDYHYTRLPAPNANGWNNTPVAITFYPGDFNELALTENHGEGAVEHTLRADDPVWTRTADIDRLILEMRARSTATSDIAGSGYDTIRIDTQAPALSYDAVGNTLSASDAVATGSGKAMSGVWKVRQVKADGRPLAAEDVTPQGTDNLTLDADGAQGAASVAAPQAAGQAEWVFSLADGKGAEAQAISNAQPGFYVAEDAAGNVSSVFEVKRPENPSPGTEDPKPPVGPDNPGGEPSPTFPTITPRPDPDNPNAPEPKPLVPTEVNTDPSSELTHAVVEDTLTLPTSPDAITSAMMARFIDERYVASTTLASGAISAGNVRLFNAEGSTVTFIDRSHPGTWIAEQTFTDGAGNTTTIRLTVQVRENSVTGSTTQKDSSSNSDGNADKRGASGNHRTAMANQLSQLPQTGGILGPCPLHVLFVLMMIMASAYGLMRRRQQRGGDRSTESDRTAAACEAAEKSTQNPSLTQQASPKPRALRQTARPQGLTIFDRFVLGAIALCALILAWLGFCPFDLLLAVTTVATCALWALLLHRPARCNQTELSVSTTC